MRRSLTRWVVLVPLAAAVWTAASAQSAAPALTLFEEAPAAPLTPGPAWTAAASPNGPPRPPGPPGSGEIVVLGSAAFEANPRTDPSVEQEVVLSYRSDAAAPVCLAVWSDERPPAPVTVEALGPVQFHADPAVTLSGTIGPPVALGDRPRSLLRIPTAGGGEVTVRFTLALDPLAAPAETQHAVHYALMPCGVTAR